MSQRNLGAAMVSCGEAGGTLVSFPQCSDENGLKEIWASAVERFRHAPHNYYVGLFYGIDDQDNDRSNSTGDLFVNP